MIFALNWLALLALSLFPANSKRADTVQLLLQSKAVQEAVFSGDPDGLASVLSETLLGRSLARESGVLVLRESILALVPGLSALVIAESLLETWKAADREKMATGLVASGAFRKLGISSEIAPSLIRFTVRPSGETEKALKRERDQLRKNAERELASLLREKGRRKLDQGASSLGF